MISLVADSGQVLDYSGEDFSFSRQVASFYDFKIKGDISVNFTIPGNSYNRGVLGYWGPMTSTNVAFSKQRFTVTQDGNPTVRGYIVIQGEGPNYELDCFFISGNANWFNYMQFKVRDIDYESEVISMNSMDARKAATSGIIFPIVDWYSPGWRISSRFRYRSAATDGVIDAIPCYYLHSLVERIAVQSNIKITGNLVNDELYKTMIITPDGPDMHWPDSAITYNWTTIASNQSVTGAVVTTLNFDTSQEGNWDTTNKRFYAYRTGTYELTIDLTTSVNQFYIVFVYKNGVSNFRIIDYNTGTATTLRNTAYINLAKGDYIDFRIQGDVTNFTVSANGSIRVNLYKDIVPFIDAWTVVPYVTPAAIVPDIKAIDIIKFLTVYFGCVATFDEYSQTLTLTKIASFDKSNAIDLSDNYVQHSVNYNTGATKNNIIQFESGTEAEIESYNRQNIVSYGGGNITTSFDIDKANKVVYTAPFGPSWDVNNKTTLKWFMPYINFFDIKDGESQDDKVTFTSVTNSGGSPVFNATNGFSSTSYGDIFRIQGTTYSGYAYLKSATGTTLEFDDMTYYYNDAGTIFKQQVSRKSGPNRLLICRPGTTLTDVGGPATYTLAYPGGGTTSSATGAVAWFDKPKLGLTIDTNLASLAIDPVLGRTYNNTIKNLYYSPIKNIFNRPLIEAYFNIHEELYQNLNFSNYVYLKVKDLQGYFFIQKMDNYKDSTIPVKCELMWVD